MSTTKTRVDTNQKLMQSCLLGHNDFFSSQKMSFFPKEFKNVEIDSIDQNVVTWLQREKYKILFDILH